IWNKGSKGVLEQVENVEEILPFELLGFDCDNGSEFLNYHLMRYFSHRRKVVQFTRSRPYHKNDNAHVEQKNWTHVRQLFGYDRFENRDLVKLMNEIYQAYWNPILNFFTPVMKLEKKERIGGRVRKKYDSQKLLI